MKEAVLEVLLYLLDKPALLAKANQGVTNSEIIKPIAKDEETLNQLAALADRYKQSLQNPLSALRVFTPEECQKLDSNSRGFILFLEHCGILNNHSREWIIEHAMAYPHPVSLEQLPWITALVLLNYSHLSKEWLSLLLSLETQSSVH